MKIIPEPTAEHCRIESLAFEQSLCLRGLNAEQMQRAFRADSGRPDWAEIAEQGTLRLSIPGDQSTQSRPTAKPDPNLPQSPPQDYPLAGGTARLTSDRPGEVEWATDRAFDDRLLPEPFNLLFAQQWARLGLFPLHAAALSWRESGILILGAQGAGKSSLVLAALNHGARVISDDWLLAGRKDGELRAERLREFLMFRPGCTWDRFGQAASAPLPVHRSGDGRYVHCITESDPRFPVWAALDQCLVLEPPEGVRPAVSELTQLHHSRLLALLLESAMPLLMTQHFGRERTALFDEFNALIKGLSCQAAVTGTDLIDDPLPVLDRLFGQAPA